MIFNKLLNYNSIFHRVFLSIPLDVSNQDHINIMGSFDVKEIVLPLRQASTVFLQKDDTFVFDENTQLNNLKYVDYTLAENDTSYKNTYKAFVAYVNLKLTRESKFFLTIHKRLIYEDLLIYSVI